jgi:hypothetical protein
MQALGNPIGICLNKKGKAMFFLELLQFQGLHCRYTLAGISPLSKGMVTLLACNICSSPILHCFSSLLGNLIWFDLVAQHGAVPLAP